LSIFLSKNDSPNQKSKKNSLKFQISINNLKKPREKISLQTKRKFYNQFLEKEGDNSRNYERLIQIKEIDKDNLLKTSKQNYHSNRKLINNTSFGLLPFYDKHNYSITKIDDFNLQEIALPISQFSK